MVSNLTIALSMTIASSNSALAASNGDNAAGVGVVLIVVSLALAAYFLPSIVAAARKHRNTTAIFFLNLLLGWSGIGWVGALIWALTNPYSATVVVNPTSPQPRPAPRENRHPCPFRAEPIVSAAKICRFCGKELPAGWSEAAARTIDLSAFESWGSRPNRDSR
jgi:Superinfection immunity protein